MRTLPEASLSMMMPMANEGSELESQHFQELNYGTCKSS